MRHPSRGTLSSRGVNATPQAPDRNLAMELVRVTEASALAASRWMGRGDKNGADGAAVNAMRIVLSSIAMDGVVVIGEGEKDEAPMLFNGERIGDGTPPKADIAVDPSTAPPRPHWAGAARWPSSPCPRRARCSTRPVRVHGEAGRRAPRRRRHRHHPAHRRQPRRRGQGQGHLGARPDRGHPRPSAPRGDHRRGAQTGPGSGSSPTATWPAPSPPPGPTPASTCWSASAAPRGGDRRRRAQVHGGRDPGPALSPRRRRAQAALDLGLRPRRRPHHGRPGEGDNCFFAATGITDGELLQGVRYDEFGANTQSLVMRSKSGTVASSTPATPSTSSPSTAPSSSAEPRRHRGRTGSGPAAQVLADPGTRALVGLPQPGPGPGPGLPRRRSR